MVKRKSYADMNATLRHKKSKKIISVIGNFVDLSKCELLDIGTGSGHIISDIGGLCKSAVSVDIQDERVAKEGYKFLLVKDENLPFEDETFDVIISNHILEHVSNQSLHLSEIHRVLKRNGIVYLSTPNRYWVKESHYRLPFIAWFPKRISAFLLKIIKGQSWDVCLCSYSDLEKLLKNRFEIRNMSLEIIKDPAKYNLDVFKNVNFFRFVPYPILMLVNPFIPAYILVLKKANN